MQFIIEIPDGSVIDPFKEKPPDGITIHIDYPIKEFAENSVSVYTIVIEVVYPIAASFLANWLYDKLKNSKSNTTTINNQKTVIGKVEINNIVVKVMGQEKKHPPKK